MKDQELDDFIGRIKDSPLPGCPGSLESAVLRRIRVSRAESAGALGPWFVALVSKPALVTALIVLVVGVSFGMTAVKANRRGADVYQQQLAVRALDFDILGHNEILNFEHGR